MRFRKAVTKPDDIFRRVRTGRVLESFRPPPGIYIRNFSVKGPLFFFDELRREKKEIISYFKEIGFQNFLLKA